MGNFQGFRLPTFHDYHKLFKVRRNFSRSSFLSISSSSLSIKIFYFLARSFWFFSWLGPLKFFRSSTFKYFGLSKNSSSIKPQPPLSKDQAQDLLFRELFTFSQSLFCRVALVTRFRWLFDDQDNHFKISVARIFTLFCLDFNFSGVLFFH